MKLMLSFSGSLKLWALGLRLYWVAWMGGKRHINTWLLQVTTARSRRYISFVYVVLVIVISNLLKRYSKAKRTRAPAYSRALRRIKGGFPKGEITIITLSSD